MIARLLVAAALLAAGFGPALACNPTLAEPLLVTDAEFIDAAGTFEAAAPGSFARLGAYDTMLRVEGAAFGTVLRKGYLSEDPALVAAATYCEVMRANGAVARVTGAPETPGDLNTKQQAQIATNAFTMGKVATDWSQGCFSTYKPPEAGCNPAYFVSVRDGLVTFRQDTNTGQFRRGDGGFFGTIELRYGGPVYTVPAELVLQ